MFYHFNITSYMIHVSCRNQHCWIVLVLKPLLSIHCISTNECLVIGTCSLVAKDALQETCYQQLMHFCYVLDNYTIEFQIEHKDYIMKFNIRMVFQCVQIRNFINNYLFNIETFLLPICFTLNVKSFLVFLDYKVLGKMH